MKHFFKLAAISCLLIASSAVTPHGAVASADVEQATNYVDTLAGQALDILNAEGNKAAKNKKLENLIKQHVDIDWIGQFVMGNHWRSASKEQQTKYLKHYKDFILQSYASRFTEYKGEGYTLIKSRQDSDSKYTVKMSIDVDGAPTMVDYKVRKKDGEYKIYDLIVEGVSLITTQRSEFNSIIQGKGIDYLIEQLANKSESALAKTN